MAPDVLNPDAVEYQGCYVWTPDGGDSRRPVKQRKTQQFNAPSEVSDHTLVVPLIGGNESQHNVQLRSSLLHLAWRSQQETIDDIFKDATVGTIDNVAEFVYGSSLIRSQEHVIPSGLVITGPVTSVFASIVSSVATRLSQEHKTLIVNLIPSQVSNLKAALKFINSRATDSDPDAGDDPDDDGQRGRRLNYDLQVLHDHVQTQGTEHVILAFHDSEAFSGTFWRDLIEVISVWIDRIPFVLLFGIKTSIELFQAKLTRKIIRCLQGVQFDVAQIGIDTIFKAVASKDSQSLWLGPGVSNLILQAQHDSIQGVAALARSMQYAYMSHFFANPLSVLLGEDLSADVFQKELYECIRNLDSFRRLAEEELNSKQVETVKFLLNDDRFLQDIAVKEIRRGTKTLSSLLTAIDLLSSMRSCLSLKASDSWSRIYIKAMAGELRDSAMIKDTLLAIRKLSSDALASLLDRLTDSPLLGISALINDLRRLVSENDSAGPLRSEHYAHRRNIRTTVVAQKVELSKHVSSLSEQDLSYSKLVDRLDRILKDFFQETLIDPSELFLHEVLVYDFKSPHREVFIPNPRYAIERALSSPRDYLGCSCCEGAHHGLSSTHPATSVLYQLYLESGAIINISDLWFAFRTIVGTDDAEDEEVEQERTLALFSRALAEMKYLGIIKNSKRKADHLAKLLWNGL